MSNTEFYAEQVSAARRQADEATLPSVRERCMRSAAAWQTMLDRQQAFEKQRANNIANRLAVL